MFKNKPPARKISYHQKSPRGKRILRWIIGIIILVILFIFLSGNRSLLKLYSLHHEKNELEKQKEAIIEEKERLENEIQKLETDDRYLEEVARDKFNMKKKEEEDNKAVPE
jgi:cell division protein FtsB